MNRTIDIIVSPNGEITINAIGFKGADCEKATRAMEEALGGVSNRVKKPEYHASTTAKHQQRLGT